MHNTNVRGKMNLNRESNGSRLAIKQSGKLNHRTKRAATKEDPIRLETVADCMKRRGSSNSMLNQGSPLKISKADDMISVKDVDHTQQDEEVNEDQLNDIAPTNMNEEEDVLAISSNADEEDNSEGIAQLIDSDDDQHEIQNLQDDEASDIFETDSSMNDEDDVQRRLQGLISGEEHSQSQDKQEEKQEIKQEEPEQPEEEQYREEMGGTLVYDSYARLVGCTKIEEYFAHNTPLKVHTDTVFARPEIKEIQKDLFQEKVRERDFCNENDKFFFKNLPRFQTQRDFWNLHHTLMIPNHQNILIFDSRFENGNLRKVAKVSNIEYNLWLENDLNTKGHTQWYYFKVIYKDVALHADKKVHRVKFNILNLAKTTSLYQVGMKPCIWSRRRNQAEDVGWFRGGENISYTQNEIPRYENQASPPKFIKGHFNNNNLFLLNNNGAGEGVDFYYTFSFTYEFEANQDDEIYFAHAIPYTFTHMQEKLSDLRRNPDYSSILKMNILCFTLGKSPVPLLTITDNVDTYLDYYEEMKLTHQIPNVVKKQYRQKYQKVRKLARQGSESKGRVKRLLEAAFEEEIKCFFEYNEDHFLTTSPSFAGFGTRLYQYLKDHGQKKAIFITSRVHPGEPQASHMLDGIISYLLSKEADELRKHFVIRIVPMLNPDGVIYGNYRCSLLGCDLNRKWEKPNRLLHPTIYYSKLLIRHMHAERKVVLYSDLHGHSRKQNAFFYGCSYKNYEQEGRIKNAQLRIIPLLCCQKNNLFQLKDSRFTIEKCKESTARVVVFREMNIMNSFTLECSFFGKEWNAQTDSMRKDDRGGGFRPGSKLGGESAFAQKFQKQKKLMHMSVPDYKSLGETVMQVMHNYLPSEQSKLQFISGKILDVFYDEFIKFIPPYILKREEEKRKKLEQGNKKDINPNAGNQSTTKKGMEKMNGQNFGSMQMQSQNNRKRSVNQTTGRHQVLDLNMQSNNKKNEGKKHDHQKAHNQIGNQTAESFQKRMHRNMLSAKSRMPRGSGSEHKGNEHLINDYDRKADRSAATRTKVANEGINGEESSDQKLVLGLSGNDETDDHFGSIVESHKNQNDIAEFEFFMDGIQSKLKQREQRRKKKLDNLLNGLSSKQKIEITQVDLLSSQLNLFISDSSDNTSSDEESYEQRMKRKQKQKKQIQKIIKKFAADKEKQKKKEEEKKNLEVEQKKIKKNKEKDLQVSQSYQTQHNKSPRSSRSPMMTLKRKKIHQSAEKTSNQPMHQLQAQSNQQPQHLNDNLIIVRGQLKRSIPPNQVTVGKDFINLEFAENQLKFAESQFQQKVMKYPQYQKINKGSYLAYNAQNINMAGGIGAHGSILMAQRTSENQQMDVTGTKLTTNTAAKIAEPSDVPHHPANPSKKQPKFSNQRDDENRALKIELSQRSTSKMLKERKSYLIKNREQGPKEQLSLSGVKLNQHSNELPPQQMAVLAEKHRHGQYDNAYGKSQLEGLNYQNIHRRIKSRSEAYQDGQHQSTIAVNMNMQATGSFMDDDQQQHIVQRNKDSAQDAENFHVFHNLALQERAIGQKQAVGSVQNSKSQMEQNQHKASKMGQSLQFVPSEVPPAHIQNQIYSQNQHNPQVFQNPSWNKPENRKQTIEINARYQVRQVSKPTQKNNMQLMQNPQIHPKGHQNRQQQAMNQDFDIEQEDRLANSPQADYFGIDYSGLKKFGENMQLYPGKESYKSTRDQINNSMELTNKMKMQGKKPNQNFSAQAERVSIQMKYGAKDKYNASQLMQLQNLDMEQNVSQTPKTLNRFYNKNQGINNHVGGGFKRGVSTTGFQNEGSAYMTPLIAGPQTKTDHQQNFAGVSTGSKTMQNYHGREHTLKEHVPHRDIKILNGRNLNFDKNEPIIMSLENPNMMQIATEQEVVPDAANIRPRKIQKHKSGVNNLNSLMQELSVAADAEDQNLERIKQNFKIQRREFQISEAQGHRKSLHMIGGQKKYQQDQLTENSMLIPVKGAFGLMDSIDHKSSNMNIEQEPLGAGLHPVAMHAGVKDGDSRVYYGTPNHEGQVFVKSQQSPRARRKIGMTIEHNTRTDKMNEAMPLQNEYLKQQSKLSMLDQQMRTHNQNLHFADALNIGERFNHSPSRRSHFTDLGARQKTQLIKNHIILKPENLAQSSKSSKAGKSKEA